MTDSNNIFSLSDYNPSDSYKRIMEVFAAEGESWQDVQAHFLSRIRQGGEGMEHSKPLLYKLAYDKAVDVVGSTGDSSSEFIDDAMKLLSAGIDVDNVTMSMPKSLRDFYFDINYIHAIGNSAGSELDNAVVEIDISNMGNANLAIGRSNVDRIVGIIQKIYENSLYGNDGDSSQLHPLLTPVRSGGDELRFYVSGLNKDEVEKRLAAAQEKVSGMICELGLDGLEHSKYSPSDNNDKAETFAGFGAGHAFVMLGERKREGGAAPPFMSKEDINKALDDKTKDNKLSHGAERRKARGDGNIISPSEFKSKLESDSSFSSKFTETLSRYEKRYIYDSRIADSKQHDNILSLPDRLRPADLGKYDDYYTALGKKISDAYNDKNKRKYLKDIADNFILTSDPVSGLKSPAAILESLDRRIKAIAKHHGEENADNDRLVELEVTNIQGINNLGLAISDVVIRHVAEIIKKEFEGIAGEGELYSGNGGRYRILIHGHSENEIDTALKNAANKIHSEINQKEIKQYLRERDCEALASNDKIKEGMKFSDITHPKRNNESGVALLFSHIELSGEKSPEEHLQISENLLEAFSRNPSILAGDLYHKLARRGIADDEEISKEENDRMSCEENRRHEGSPDKEFRMKWSVGNSMHNGELDHAATLDYLPYQLGILAELSSHREGKRWLRETLENQYNVKLSYDNHDRGDDVANAIAADEESPHAAKQSKNTAALPDCDSISSVEVTAPTFDSRHRGRY